MTLTKLEPLQFLVNMIDLKIEKPKEPEPIKCKKCNSLIHAYYVDPEFWNGRILSFSNIWKFSSETCDVCLKKLREEEEIKQEIKRNALLQEQENKRLIELLNEKGFKEFYFSSYEPTFETMVAFNACSNFDPLKDDLFLFGCRLALARGCCCCHCFLVLVCGRGGAWACMGVRGAFAFCSGAVPFVSCLPVSPPGRLFLVPWVCGWGFAPPRLIFWIVNIP